MKPTVPAPAGPAAWKPWVFRADAIDRNATVDLALLAKGFHIVAHRLPSNPAWCNNSGQTRLSRLKAGCSQDWLPTKQANLPPRFLESVDAARLRTFPEEA